MEDSSRKRKAEAEDVVDDESEGSRSANEEPIVQEAPTEAPSQGNDTAAEAEEASDSAAGSVEPMEVTGLEEDEGQLERNALASSPVPSDTALDVMADGPAVAEVSAPDAPLTAPSTESAEAVAGAVPLADAGKKKKKQKMEVPPRSIPTRASGGGADSPVKIDEASTTLTKGGSLPRELKNLMLDDNANKRKREGDEVVFIQSGAKPPRKVRLSHNGGMSEVHAGAHGTRRSPRVAGDMKEGLPPALAGFSKPKTESAASAGGGGHAKGGSATQAAVGAKGAITTGAGKRAAVVGSGGSGGVGSGTGAAAAAVGVKGGVPIAGTGKAAGGGAKKGHGGKGGGGKGGKGGKRASTGLGGAQAEPTAATAGEVPPVDAAAADGGFVKATPAPVDGTTAKEASAVAGEAKDAPAATNADTEGAFADVADGSQKPGGAAETEAQAAVGSGSGGDGDAKSALSVDAGEGGAAVAEGASQKPGDAIDAKAVTVVGPAQKKQAVVRIVEGSGEALGAKRERRKGELMKLMDDPVAAAVASRKAAGEDAGKAQGEGVSAGPSLSRSTRSRTHEAVASAEGKDDGSQVQGGTEQEKQEAADAEDKRKGRWRAFGKGPPKKLVFTDDRLHKCVKLDDVIFIAKRDADTGAHEGKAFEWNEKGYFIVALHNPNDERVKPSEFDNARVQYIVASMEDDGSQEELYSGSVSATAHHGSYYFKALHFLLPGTYTLSFKLLNDKYKKCTLELTTKVCIEGTDPSAPQPRPTPPPTQPASADAESQPPAPTATSSAPAPPPPPPLLKPRTRSTTPTGGASSSSAAAPAAASAQPVPTKLTAGISSSSTSSVHKGRRSRHTDTHKEGEGLKSEAGGPEVISNDGHGDADGSLNFDDALQRGPIISLRVPGALRKVLLEDWFCATRKRKLVPLPCTHTVAEIVKNFEKDTVLGPRRTNKGQGPGERLCHLFNGAVASLLLYRFEKEQYLAACEKTKALPQNLYGAHHLLRLLVSAPRFFTPDETDPSTAPFAVLKQRHSSTSSATGSMAAAAASSAASGSGNAANADADNKGKGRASSSTSTELKVPTALSDEVEGIRLYLQGLLDYLDEHRDKLFTDHEDVPERYGVDVPKVAPPRAPKSSSSSASAAAVGSGEKGAPAPAAGRK